MEKRCRNCANGTWTKGADDIPEVCLKCANVHGEPSNWKERTMTNADRIRAMSDEELEYFLRCEKWECVTHGSCDGCPLKTPTRCLSVLEWLKQPAEVE